MDNINRLARRLLACANCSKQETFPRLPLQGNRLAISGNAIRPQHSSTGLYEDYLSCSSGDGPGRHLVPSLPGRSLADRTYEGRMPSGVSKSPDYHEKHGSADKREEIETHPGSKVRMVGDQMGPSSFHSTSGGDKIPVSPGRSDFDNNITILYKENNNESTRSVQLDRQKRPQHSPSDVNNETNSKGFLNESSRYVNTNSEEPEDASLRLDHSESISTTVRITKTGPNNPDRCIPKRLGFPNKPNCLQRQFRPVNDTFHQRQGIADYLVCTTDDIAEEYGNSGTLRQLLSHTRTKKGRFNVISPVLHSRVNLEESSKIQLDSRDISHSRHIQCPGRSTFQKHSFIHRMDTESSGFSENPQDESETTSGLVCDEIEQETSSVCVTLSRSNSSSSKCTNNIMGQMGSPVHVPSDTFNFEGFEPTDSILLQERNTYHTGHTHKAVVHDPTTTESVFNTNRSEASADSSRQVSSPTQYYKTSRVAVIRTAYETRFQSCQQTISLLTTPIRPSSLRDYQIKWNKFRSFLTERKIPPDELSLANVLDFFSYLFFVKKLRANTVAHYRSALTVPLQLEFQINLHDPAVSRLIRAMQIQRPNAPAIAPAWSLNKVLLLLDSWPNKVPLDNLLQKTAFLLLLATGWRISELHACVRTTEFCSISKDLTLSLRPHPSFLAKNECPRKRWSHKTIPALRLQDGSISKLCPVNTLLEYLSRTARITDGSLLVHPSNQKSMTIYQLSSQICKLIHKAEPETPAKVHDIRKYAASCSLAETMDVSGMVTALQWKSPQTFYKFYMSPTISLTVPVTLPHAQDPYPRIPTNSQKATTSNEEETSDMDN